MQVSRKACLFCLAALLLSGAATLAQNRGTMGSRGLVNEDFSQSYPLSSEGRVSLKNVCGDIVIQSWDRQEVLVEAVKTANSAERLAEAEIRVDMEGDSVHIETEYPSYGSFSCSGSESWNRWDNDSRIQAASVAYTLTVPRSARIDEVKVVNSNVDLSGLDGDVNISTVNGDITAAALSGRADLSTVNGRVEAEGVSGPIDFSTVNGTLDVHMASLQYRQKVSLKSVNGEVILRLPRDAAVEVEAKSVHGRIRNDFGWEVDEGRYVGRSLRANTGRDGARIQLSNVNGAIRIAEAGR